MNAPLTVDTSKMGTLHSPTLSANVATGGQKEESGATIVVLDTAINLYIDARRHELARQSIREYGQILSRFSRHLGPMAVKAVKRDHVESWKATRDIGPRTLRHELSTVRGLFAWLIVHGHVKNDPTLGVKTPRVPRGGTRGLTPVQVRDLIVAAPDARSRLIILLMRVEGLRRGEVATLDFADVDLEEQMLDFVGKGGDRRRVPLSDQTSDALAKYLLEHPARMGPLVRSYTHPGEALSPGYVTELVSRWMLDAGVKRNARDGRSAHALRHTAALSWLDQGADPHLIQQGLGHASIGTTWDYLRRTAQAEKLRPFMRMA